jgi:hypothetical protein
MNKKKTVIVVLGLGAVGAIVYFLFFNKSTTNPFAKLAQGLGLKMGSGLPSNKSKGKTNQGTNTNTNKSISTGSGACSGYKAESWPLSKCMQGPTVKQLQHILNTVYASQTGGDLTEDGQFGQNTLDNLNIIGLSTVTEAQFNQLSSANASVAATIGKGTASDNNDEYDYTFDSFLNLNNS